MNGWIGVSRAQWAALASMRNGPALAPGKRRTRSSLIARGLIEPVGTPPQRWQLTAAGQIELRGGDRRYLADLKAYQRRAL
jgi:hypothetical protein